MDEVLVKKQEGSVPVQGRVSIINLAKLSLYWESEGYHMRSLSQLLAWSIELICDVLEENGKMPDGIDSIVSAYRCLKERGLKQESMHKKGIRKISTAMGFESLREEGINPEEYVPKQFKVMHNKNSVKPPDYKKKGSLKEMVEFMEKAKKRDGEVVSRENAPVDVSEMELVDEDGTDLGQTDNELEGG